MTVQGAKFNPVVEHEIAQSIIYTTRSNLRGYSICKSITSKTCFIAILI
jgi:hypothetical protein